MSQTVAADGRGLIEGNEEKDGQGGEAEAKQQSAKCLARQAGDYHEAVVGWGR